MLPLRRPAVIGIQEQDGVAFRPRMRAAEIAHFVRRMLVVGEGMERFAAAVRSLIEEDDVACPTMPPPRNAARGDSARDKGDDAKLSQELLHAGCP